MKKLIMITSVLSLFILVGQTCSTNSTTTTDADSTNTAAVETTSDDAITDDNSYEEVPFAEIGDSMLDKAGEGWSEFKFTNGAGTCVDEGLTEFSYKYDDNLEYFIVATPDGEYKDSWAALYGSGKLQFDEFELESGTAECEAISTTGENTAPVTCTIMEKQVCTGTYDVMAIPE